MYVSPLAVMLTLQWQPLQISYRSYPRNELDLIVPNHKRMILKDNIEWRWAIIRTFGELAVIASEVRSRNLSDIAERCASTTLVPGQNLPGTGFRLKSAQALQVEFSDTSDFCLGR